MNNLDDLIERLPKIVRYTFFKFLEKMEKKGYVEALPGLSLTEEFAKVVIYSSLVGIPFPDNYFQITRN